MPKLPYLLTPSTVNPNVTLPSLLVASTVVVIEEIAA